MSRLQLVNPANTTGKVKEIFDGPLKGKHLNIFKALGNSPAALQTYLGLAGALSHSRLTEAEREAIQLAIGETNGCEYCVGAHTGLGMKAGLSKEQTIEARRGALKEPRLNALVQFTLKLQEKRGRVSDDDLSRVRAAGFDDGQIADSVAAWTLATFTNYFNNMNRTPMDVPAAPAL